MVTLRGDVDTYYEDGSWKNKFQGNTRASNVHTTKADAQKAGREMAKDKGAEHIIRNMNGQIGQRNSYGGDPHPPKG